MRTRLLTGFSLLCILIGIPGFLWSAERRVEISLRDALGSPAKKQMEGDRDLYIQSIYSSEQGFEWLMGQAPDFNRAFHRGRVLENKLESDGSLELEMWIHGDPWVPGGRARFRLNLKQVSDQEWRGSYSGLFEQIPGRGTKAHPLELKGEAVLTFTAPATPDPDFQPTSLLQHPRMLVAYQEVKALRSKSTSTELGRALRQQILESEGALSRAMASLLKEDADLARSTIPDVRKKLADESPGAFNGSDGAYAKRVGEIVKIYDLCYPHWPEELQREVDRELARKAEKMIFRPNTVTRKTNWSPNSNYSGHFNGAGGMAGIALLGKPGPRPIAPVEPAGSPVQIVAPKDSDLPKDLPVLPFVPGIMPDEWWVLGPIPTRELETMDELPAAFRNGIPGKGPSLSAAKVNGSTYAFQQPGDAIFWTHGGEGPQHRNLELMRSTNKAYFSSVVFVTQIKVEETGTYQFKEHTGGGHSSRYWVSGNEVRPGDLVQLEPGVHPLRVSSRFFKINPWGKSWVRPNFKDVTEEQIQDALYANRTLYELERAAYQEDLAYWEENDGASPRYKWIFLCGTQKATEYHRYTFGDGGFQVEGEVYTGVGADLPMLFETCFVNSFGHASTGRPDVTHVGPRYVAQTIYSDSAVEAQQSFSLSDGTQPLHRWPLAFEVIPEEWKAACLWAWNLGMGIPEGGLGRSASEWGREDASLKRMMAKGGNAVMNLLYYPVELEAQNPEGRIPRFWEAESKGLYVFRNGWDGPENDIVAQTFLKAEGEGGWQNQDAGSIRLWGLGHAWTERGKGVGKTRERHAESVLLLPGLTHNRGMRARKEQLQSFEDGSGLIQMNLDGVYAGAKAHPSKKGRSLKLVDNRFQLKPEHFVETGVTGSRTFAADYSGKQGADAVFVLRDQVQGHPRATWMWQLPASLKREQVEIQENAFVIRQPGGVLRAQFYSNSPIKLRWSDLSHSKVPAKDRAKKKEVYRLHALSVDVEAGDTAVDLLAVITLDASETPDIPVRFLQDTWRIDSGREIQLGPENVRMTEGP